MALKASVNISPEVLEILKDSEKIREVERAIWDEFLRLQAEEIDRRALEGVKHGEQ